jgi:predicted phage tail protein
MFKKIAAAAVLAGALAFSAAAPAVLSAGSIADTTGVSVAVGNWPDPMSKKTKDTKETKETDTTYTTYVGNWPDPM